MAGAANQQATHAVTQQEQVFHRPWPGVDQLFDHFRRPQDVCNREFASDFPGLNHGVSADGAVGGVIQSWRVEDDIRSRSIPNAVIGSEERQCREEEVTGNAPSLILAKTQKTNCFSISSVRPEIGVYGCLSEGRGLFEWDNSMSEFRSPGERCS